MRRFHSRSLSRSAKRCGAVTVEVALTLPIFVMFLAALMEFGHYYMVVHTLNGAARRGAHLGCCDGISTAQVETQVKSIVNAAFNSSQATVLVKDASVFDTANVNPSTLNYSSLPSVDLSQADTGDVFLVQVQVPYDNVSLLPPFWIQGRTVTGRAVMRHE